MPNLYRVAVGMEKKMSYSGWVYVETMSDLDETVKVGEEVEEAIKEGLEAGGYAYNDDFWNLEEEDVDEYEVLGKPKKMEEEIKKDGQLLVQMDLDITLDEYKDKIAEKDKEIAELKKQLEKK